ncbi:hypothetical protein Deipr_2701 (plasmid) [Deinococcus proteolyticus MRP]|uniref:Uncharacterized protein n=1 Tax=Deinococcus proteolyticus (strain ATCC 35074 / DSM 20540 / JCM 6276 / NBRC 101906 / NCIMB 13154 / VKM Ac-1939 / CCM 2703 / MRP) TaxID=693977 RepID=F0RR92_DEIPM|nr:hypothetical protein [Deinococcus proteolyticus]ADY27801.1 hypothetical protein Deipr_2701 [Deinococcus proteolyticus MRP]
MSRDPELDRSLSAAWQSLEQKAAQEGHRPRIAQRVAALLPPDLAPAVLERERLGVLKYGQYLDDNHQPQRARAVHLVQELLDGANYALWLASPIRSRLLAVLLAFLVKWLCRRYHLTAQDIIDGGKR